MPPLEVTGAEVSSFNAFYRAEFASIAAVAAALCGDRASGEDIAQEALSRAYRDWQRISAYERPGAWVRRVAINLATSRHRRALTEARSRWRLTESQVVDPVLPDAALPDAALWRAVRTLPRRQRQAVALTYVDDLALEDVAAAMDCSVGAVKTHLHRARQTLANRLASRDGEDSR